MSELQHSTRVCYMTEALLRRVLGLANDSDLSRAKASSLSLCGRRAVRGKLRRIEPALGSLSRLRSLDLSFNRIARIEHLSSLVHLRELDLFENRLTGVDGLEALALLERLNLSGNRITSIAALAKLPCLTTLRLGTRAKVIVNKVSANRQGKRIHKHIL